MKRRAPAASEAELSARAADPAKDGGAGSSSSIDSPPSMRRRRVLRAEDANAANSKKDPASNLASSSPSLGLHGGEHVEVLWTMGPDTDDHTQSGGACARKEEVSADRKNTVEMWWPAIVCDPTDKVHLLLDPDTGESLEVPVHALRYCPRPDDGFPEPSIDDVCFVNEHRLLDLQFDGLVYWRRLGSTWEPPPFSDEEDEDLVERPGQSQPNPDFAALKGCEREAIGELVEGVVGSLLRAHASHLRGMPATRQLAIAERMAAMRKKLVDRILDYQRSKSAGGGEVVIDDSTMRGILDNLGSELTAG